MQNIEIRESCGVGGVIAPRGKDAAPIAAKLGLDQQNRGEEGAGFATKFFDGNFSIHKGSKRFGLVFPDTQSLREYNLQGELGLVHTRYRTTGSADDTEYAQPFIVNENSRTLAGAHNGNIANAEELLVQLKSEGVELQTGKNGQPPSDSEILFRRLARAKGESWPEKIANGLTGVEGSFSLIMVTDDNQMIALRDPWGIRPLSYGRLNGHWVVASETSALDKIGTVEKKEVQNGQMVVFGENRQPIEVMYNDTQQKKYCDFEDWYFSYPSSQRNGISVNAIRKACGNEMAMEEIVNGRLRDADLVTCVPDTARSGALPFSYGIGIPYSDEIYKDKYGDKGIRSFIGSNDLLRKGIADDKYKFSPDLEGKRIYVVDDTAVRLTTTKILTTALKERSGVDEVHLRFLAPKFIRPCFLGVNINSRDELGVMEIKGGRWRVKTDEQIAEEIGADSVAFLSMDGRRRVREKFGENPEDFCGYCHGEEGPNINFGKYDPGLKLELMPALVR